MYSTFFIASLCILFFNFMLHSKKLKHMPKFIFSLSCLVIDLKKQKYHKQPAFPKDVICFASA